MKKPRNQYLGRRRFLQRSTTMGLAAKGDWEVIRGKGYPGLTELDDVLGCLESPRC